MKRINSIISAVLIGLMMFVSYPGALYSNAGAQIIPDKSAEHFSDIHEKNGGECNEASCDCSHEENGGECHETPCDCSHEEKDGQCYEALCGCRDENCGECHKALCGCEAPSGKGVKIAVFDSGIGDVETAGGISFVEDKEILSTHGDTVAHILKNLVPDARLYDVRILDNKNEGTYGNLAKGVDWAVRNGIDIISLGMVGYESSDILENALKKAEENNILVIAAAGNGSSDETTYPAAYPTVISVGALDENSEIAEYSNYGSIVDVFAYASFKGTSFAAQNIVAAAAKKIEANPDISVKDIRTQITGGKTKKSVEKNNAVTGILYAAATCVHSFNGSYTITKAATCTVAGTKVGKCTKCGKVLSTVSIPALGHSYGSWTTTRKATCTATGSKKRTCSRCSSVDTDTIAATGHSFSGSYTITKAATCTVAGTKEGKCNNCGAVVSTVSIPALGHSYGSWTTTRAATCTAAGSKKRTCSRCSAVDTDTIAATGHSFSGSFTITKAATCTAEGTKVGNCNWCGAVVTTVSIPALGHSYGSWTTVAERTCTTNGMKKRTCTRCSAADTETLTATGHSFSGSFTIIKEPTCTATGTKVGKCNNCGAVVTTVSIPELGHSYGSWTTFKAATCTEDGVAKRTCTRCSASETQTLPSTGGHSFSGSFTVTKEATCTTAGTKVGNCNKCGAVVTTVGIPALGHSYGSWTTMVEATCTTNGMKLRKCTRDGCNSSDSETITAPGHSFSGSFTIKKAPTCTEEGTKVGNCNKCGGVVTTVSIPALGHSYGSWTTMVEATCTTNGMKLRKCTRDGCNSSDSETITAPGHSFSGSFTIKKAPTCTEEGTKVGNCNKCGAVVTTVGIPALGHSYGSWMTMVEATCTTNGMKLRKCTRDGCNSSDTETITATGHSFSGSFAEGKAPTCTTPGTKLGKCNNCGTVLSTVEIPMIDHKYGSWIIIKAATCNVEGSKRRVCAVCNHNDVQTIPAGVHSFSGSYTISKKPTCTEEGTKVGKCNNCGKVLSTISIPPLSPSGHTFNGSYNETRKATCALTGIKTGKCTKCGAVVSTVEIPKLPHLFEKITMTPASDYITTANTLSGTIQVNRVCVSCGRSEDITGAVTFSSSNSSVATVTGGRIRSGTKEGTATITAYYGGKRAVCSVTVNIPGLNSLRALRIEPSSETITEYNKSGSKLKVTAVYDNGPVDVTDKVTFTSGNSSIAYVQLGYIKSGFSQGSTIIAAAYESLRATCSVTVDMYANAETKPLELGSSTGLTIPEDLPVLGGSEINFGLDFIPASISIGKDEFKIAVGVDDVKSIGEDWRDFKKTFEEAKKGLATANKLRSAMKAFGSKTGSFNVTKGWEPSMDVYGYIEGTVNNGVPTVTKGGIVIVAEANYTTQTQYFIGPVPVYLEIGGGVKLELDTAISGYIPSSGKLQINSELTITPRFEIGGGVGIANVVTVGGTGEAELEFKIREGYLKVTLTGKLNLKATALFFEYKKTIAQGTWNLYETRPSARSNELSAPPNRYSEMYNSDSYSMMPRDYINRPSDWTGDDKTSFSPGTAMAPNFTNKEIKTLGTNIYPNAQTQLINYGDKQVLVWVADNAGRTGANRTMLVYSVYDKASKLWSEPAAIDDDGTADFYPQLARNDRSLYVVWQNSNKTFSEEDTLESVAASGEIAVSEFNAETNTFGKAVQLTKNDVVDTIPQVAASDDDVYITWTSNDKNDIFGVNGKNSICYSELTYEGWSAPLLLCEGLNAIPSLSAGFIENTFTVAYVTDGDNALGTVNDREVYIARPDSAGTRLTNNETLDSSPVFSRINGADALYWYNEGNIKYLTKLDQEPGSIFKEPNQGLKDDFRVLDGSQDETAIIWHETMNGSTGIYAAMYDAAKGEWSGSVKLSDIGSEVRSLDGTFDSNGNFGIAFSKSIMLDDENERSDLCMMRVTPSYNLSVNSVNYNQGNVIPGIELPIDVEISNNGEIGVEEVVVDIMDGTEIVTSRSVQTSLKPGETKTLTVSMILPETIAKNTYSVTVTTVAGEEYDTKDNTKEFVIGYTDISLEFERQSEDNIEAVAVHVLNLSHVPSGAVLKVTKGSESGEVLDTKVIDNVDGELVYNYRFDKNVLCADKDSETIYFTVAADREELYTSDNSKFIVLKKSSIPFMYGDVDADGKVTSSDYALMLRYVLGMIDKDGFIKSTGEVYPEGVIAADVDGSRFTEEKEKFINSADLAYVKRHILGMITKFPVEEMNESMASE